MSRKCFAIAALDIKSLRQLLKKKSVDTDMSPHDQLHRLFIDVIFSITFVLSSALLKNNTLNTRGSTSTYFVLLTSSCTTQSYSPLICDYTNILFA